MIVAHFKAQLLKEEMCEETEAGGRGDRGRGGLGARPPDPELEWSRIHNSPAVRPFTEPSPGPTQRYEDGADTREGVYFEQIFIDEMLDMAITETDYCDERAAAEPNKHKKELESSYHRRDETIYWHR